MLKLSNISGMLLLGFCMLLFTGCGEKQQKNNDTASETISAEAMAEFQNEKKELLAKANAQLSEINQKILACNDKIKAGTKLTDAQNKALDEFEAKRATVNKRIHEIKNVSYENWGNFKASFESDLEEVGSDIEKILTEL